MTGIKETEDRKWNPTFYTSFNIGRFLKYDAIKVIVGTVNILPASIESSFEFSANEL